MLKFDNLTKIYQGNKAAVQNLSLEVEAGDIYGFIGHNGAGKTTAIKCAVGLTDITSGDVTIDGVSITRDPLACKRLFAYIPDNPDVYEYLTGIQYLNFLADVYKIDKAEREKNIYALTDVFGITGALGSLISSYSHGMKQKLVITGAVFRKPKLLILDEPFVGLDPQAIVSLKQIMKDLCNSGSAIFFSTHVLDVAEKLCNKVAIIKQGKLVAAGETDKLTDGRSLEETFMGVVKND